MTSSLLSCSLRTSPRVCQKTAWLLALAALASALGCSSTSPTPTAPAAALAPAAETVVVPKGSLSGRIFRRDTQGPVGNVYLSINGPTDYFGASTDGYGRFTAGGLPEGAYTVTFYEEGYKKTEFGPFAVGKDEKVSGVEIAVDPVDPQIAPYTYQDVYLPSENVQVLVRSIRVTSLDVDLYRVPDTTVREGLSTALARKNLPYEAYESLLSYKQPVAGGGKLTWRTTPVQPAFDKPGIYVVRVRGGKSDVALPLVVTSLSLITKRGPNGTIVYAQHLSKGTPLKDVAVQIERNAAPAAGWPTTDARGLATLAGGQAVNARVWGFSGPDVAYVDTAPPSASVVAPYRAYLITDRPLYRAGHEVHYKVVARANRAGAYHVVPDERWTVTLRDPEGRVVETETNATNLFGSLSGTFTLDPEASLGPYTITAEPEDGSQAAQAVLSFEVQQYRKPEFELQVRTDANVLRQGQQARVTVQGRYYFGAPLAGATVYYTLFESPYAPWRDVSWGDLSAEGVYDDEERWSQAYGYGRALTSGSLALGADGKGHFDLEVPTAVYDRKVMVEVSAVDASGREVTTRRSVVVAAGSFGLALNARGAIFKTGEPIPLELSARTFDGAGASAKVKVTASLETWHPAHKFWIYKPLGSTTVQTNSEGIGRWEVVADKSGVLRVDAVATDGQGNTLTDTRWLWVTASGGVGSWQKKKSMEIVVDKPSYAPGETARVLINSQVAGAHIWFTEEDATGVRKSHLIKLNGNSGYFELALKESDAPTLYLSAAFTSQKQFYSTHRAVAISPASRMLNVQIQTNKPVVAPGETLEISLQVTDAQGKPARAEVALAVVDEAIYAMAEDNVPHPGAFFYGPRQSAVTTSYSYPSRYLGGASKDGGDGTRRNFKDTAHWDAHVVTGDDGRATAKVVMPDNLTEWRIVARAVTAEESGKRLRVGQGKHSAVTAKDLVMRVLPPRFFTAGDRVLLPTQMHNLSADAALVSAELSGHGPLEWPAQRKAEAQLGAGDHALLRWPVRATAVGTARILAAARSAQHQDAMEVQVPVFPVSVPRTLAVSGSLRPAAAASEGEVQFEVPANAVAGTVALSLEFAPSLAGLALETEEALERFPYACVEQTLSAFLPAVVLQTALADLNQTHKRLAARLPARVARGLSRLARLQRDDGGWGWWEYDSSQPFLTAYVMSGLHLLGRAGFEVDPDMLERGRAALSDQLSREPEGPGKAYLLYAQALDPEMADETLHALRSLSARALQAPVAGQPAFDAWSLATLALATQAAGEADAAAPLLDRLATLAKREGALAYFGGTAWRYGWNENAIETTALAIQAFASKDAGHPLVEPLTRWLISQRRGGLWDTSRDSAVAVFALAEVLRGSGEGQAEYTAEVQHEGRTVAQFKVSPDNALSLRHAVTLDPAALSPGKHSLQVRLSGHGALYWSGALKYGAPPTPRAEGLRISRQYERVVRALTPEGVPIERFEALSASQPATFGDELRVVLEVQTDEDQAYIIVEDPLAAGLEVMGQLGRSPLEGEGWSHWYSHFETRDHKVAFFATQLPKGSHRFEYRVRAELPGEVNASPAAAWHMYLPTRFANTAADTLTIREAK